MPGHTPKEKAKKKLTKKQKGLILAGKRALRKKNRKGKK